MKATATLLTAMAVVAGTSAAGGVPEAQGAATTVVTPAHRRIDSVGSTSATWTYQRLTAPDRVRVLDGTDVPVATFTVGARTVTLRGSTRVFVEPATTTASVTSTTWVRLLSQPFAGTVDTAWLTAALSDTSPDVLATAAQYVTGAPRLLASDGNVLAGDADFGPLRSDGTRAEGSDFNDYLGRPWSYGTTTDKPEAPELNALDCSGFVRMVLGYRLKLAMTLDPDGVRLPRRAVQMLASAPGVVTVPNTGSRPVSTSALAPGDLLFFDASTDDGTAVDHVALYLGLDSVGAPRFVSSRKTANGPTLGDVGGKSLLTGSGLYAVSWRAARRI